MSSPKKPIKLPYKVSFQPEYTDLSEMTTKLLKQTEKQNNKQNKQKPSVGQINNQLLQLSDNIQQNDLKLDAQSIQIFYKFASNNQSQEKMKTRSDVCPLCGTQMKKVIQCQLCAEVYCKDCCWRKRVIPELNDNQPKNSCQICHKKYIKLFNDQGFHQQKQLLFKIVQATKKKIQKTNQKASQRQKILYAYNVNKRDNKIKEGNLIRKNQQQEKKLRQVQEQLRKLVKQKAQKIRQQQQKNQKIRKKQQQQQKRRLQQKQAMRIKQEKLKKEQEELKKIRQRAQQQQKLLLKKKKQQEQLQKKLQIDKILLKERQKQLQQKIKQQKQEQQKTLLNIAAKKNQIKNQLKVQQKFDINKSQKKQVNQTNETQRSTLVLSEALQQRKFFQEHEVNKSVQNQQAKEKQQIINQNKTHRKNKATFSKLSQNTQQNKNGQSQSATTSKSSQQPFQKQNKLAEFQNEKFEKKIVNPNQMSINDILSAIVPVRPQQQSSALRLSKRKSVSSQLDVQCDSSPLRITKQNQQSLQKLRKTLNQPDIQQDNVSMDKIKRRQSLLRQSSLMSSTKTNPNQNNQLVMDPNNKCSCQIM